MWSNPVYFGTDLLVTLLLLLSAIAAYRNWKLLNNVAWKDAGFWRVLTFGFLYLAVDELFGMHEMVGRTISWAGVPSPWHTEHWDDLVLALYFPVAGVTVLWWRREVLRVKRLLHLFVVGLALTALAMLLDNTLHSPNNEFSLAGTIEEIVELAAAGTIAFAIRTYQVYPIK